MNVVVIGYGRVGSSAIRELMRKGHHVLLIEQRADRIERAQRVEHLEVVRGNAIDAEIQRRAHMHQADLLLALTRDDNVNLVAGEVARLQFKVPHVLARIYVPSRAAVVQELGIQTICPTLYTVDAIRQEVDRIAGTEPAAREEIHADTEIFAPIEERPLDESKFVLISGGGKIGSGLARALLTRGIECAIIEKDPNQAAAIGTHIDVPVVVGDGSTRSVLESAGIGRARVFAAVTGSDEDNLIGCQTAKDVFHVNKTVARVSNPKNEEIMRKLGVDTTVSTTAIISSYIERELPGLQIRTLLSLQSGNVLLFELQVPQDSPATGRPLKDVALPPDTNIVAVLRERTTVVTRGDTVIEPEDTVLVLTHREQEEAVRRAILGR
jgi:trk/ktr system potassium uptake protein